MIKKNENCVEFVTFWIVGMSIESSYYLIWRNIIYICMLKTNEKVTRRNYPKTVRTVTFMLKCKIRHDGISLEK